MREKQHADQIRMDSPSWVSDREPALRHQAAAREAAAERDRIACGQRSLSPQHVHEAQEVKSGAVDQVVMPSDSQVVAVVAHRRRASMPWSQRGRQAGRAA